MKKIIFLLPILILLSCSSATYIKTIPSGAKVYAGGALMGATPYMHWDIDAVDPGNPDYPGRTFTLKKNGYKDKTITIKKNVLNIPKIFFPVPLLALPWIYDYPYEYYFELDTAWENKDHSTQNIYNKKGETGADDKSYSAHSKKLRELKKLYDEGLITDKEYIIKRKAIVDGI